MDLFLLICHRSERSEVKRSRESMGGVYLWIATATLSPRNDDIRMDYCPPHLSSPSRGEGSRRESPSRSEGRGTLKGRDPLTQGAGVGHPERDDR
ncbi:MAG: hypothetical protein NC218_08840 [Acetobacter sp.]|nr:hypothetical protein [Acetobacter sp.]